MHINDPTALTLVPPVPSIFVFLHFLLAYCIAAFKLIGDEHDINQQEFEKS